MELAKQRIGRTKWPTVDIIESYRNPEFNRDWNIDAQTGYSDRLLRLSSTLGYGAKCQDFHSRYNASTGISRILGTGISWKQAGKTVFKIILRDTICYSQTGQNQRSKYLRPGIVIAAPDL